MIDRILQTNPPVGLEIIDIDPLPGTIFCRVYVAQLVNGQAVMPERFTAHFTIDPASSSEEDQLGNILKYCGAALDTNANGFVDAMEARAWLARTPKEEVVNAIRKWLNEVFFPALSAAVNKFVSALTNPAPAGETYVDFEAAMKDIVGRRMTYSVGADGKVSFSI
jgi:hypothetical protein